MRSREEIAMGLPFNVQDLGGLRDDFAAGRVRQVGIVARRLLATLDAVLSSQGMVRASIESAHAAALTALTAERDALAALLKEARVYVAVMREAAIEEREASGIDIGRADRVTGDLLARIDAASGGKHG